MNSLIIILAFVGHLVAARELIDLTYTYGQKSVIMSMMPPFKRNVLFSNYTDSNVWLEYGNFSMPEHGGTHMDAPVHFAKGKWSVHEIPVDRLVGPGVIIDVREQASANSEYRMTVEDVKKWERVHGNIPDNAFVFMRSGWGSRYPNATLVFNAEYSGGEETYHFPGIHVSAAKWIMANRKISMLGVDTPSVDYGQSKFYRVHIELCSNNIPCLENVANLDQVPESGTTIYAFPLKLEDGSGSPVRIIAIKEDDETIARKSIPTHRDDL